MKTFPPGFSDSIAVADARPCPYCDSTSQIAGGLCVGCLLESGLRPADESESESLAGILAEVNLPDQNWRLGNYEILEEIGRGGMGVIYRARQRHSRRIVALKRVLSYHSDSQETLARFRREAQAAASLDHPNILPIYEVSESEGLPFFSMKFAAGGSLQQVAPALRKEPRQSVALVAKVARAVQYAHSRGILHRDLKPGNILLDARGEPLVADFGLAKWLDATSDLTRTLTIFGTPGYIAPEQVSSPAAELRPTADVYSLGAILFDLLAGRPPFLGTHALSVIHQASESTAPKLRTLSKIADRDLETICSRCLEREQTRRYRSAHDLAEDLERWLEDRPIIARPVSPPVKVWRWSRRNPKLAASIVAVVVLTAVGLFEAVASNRLWMIVRNAQIAQRSVVIAPFEDLDAVSTDSAVAHTLTKSLGATLKAAKGIELREIGDKTLVVDAWKAEDYKKFGEHAAARMIVTGSVRMRAGKRRLAIYLINASTGTVHNKWLLDTDSYSMVAADIAGRIAADLAATEGSDAEEQTRSIGTGKDPTARSYYERGREFFNRHNFPDLDRAIDSLRTAVRLDPTYARAFALLATACQLRSVLDPSGPWLTEADAAVSKALSIAPMLAEGYDARGENILHHNRPRESLDDFLTAYELDPRNGRACSHIAHASYLIGRPDKALLWYTRASRRETQPVYADNIGEVWTALGHYDKAEEAFNTAAIFRPDLPVSAIGLSRLELFRGEFDKTRALSNQACEKYKNNSQALIMAAQVEFFSRNFDTASRLYSEIMKADPAGGVHYPNCGSVRFLSAVGFIHAAMGASDGKALLNEALMLDRKEISATPDNPALLYSLAADFAALGEGERSLDALESSIEAGWIDFRSPTLDPRFDAVRGSSRFQQATVRLEESTRAMTPKITGR